MGVVHYTPHWLTKFFPALLWQIPNNEKAIYLTFDDGPIPEVTPWVLEQLKQYNAQASFFCVGENAEKHPAILAQIAALGHTIGSHTYHHKSSWKVNASEYVQEVDLGHKALGSVTANNYFRPPYGKISVLCYSKLTRKYKVVMWSVLSGDYSQALSAVECLERTIKYTKAGSILVFHDSLKAWPNLKEVLPAYLAWAHAQNYVFRKLP